MSGNNIQMVDLKSQYNTIKTEVDEAIQNVINSSTFINGPEVKLFAQELTFFTNQSLPSPNQFIFQNTRHSKIKNYKPAKSGSL